MMRFRLISDVHNEFYEKEGQIVLPPILGEDEMTLIIAGDFTMLKRGSVSADVIDQYAKRLRYVLYVPGNHEFYGTRIDERKNREQFEALNPHGHKNVKFMIRDSIIIDGIKFVGATLWTDMRKGCPLAQFDLQMALNDFKAITYFDPIRTNYSKFKPRHWLMEHAKDFNYIKSEVDSYIGDVVVITHHAPSMLSQDDRYIGHTSTPGYCNELDQFIESRANIKYWLHGHVHQTHNYMIGGCNVVSNPVGYTRYLEITGFIGNQSFTI